jgi:TrmH family RNA methyltransferase
VPTELGIHSPRIERVRELRTPRGRREQGCYAVEGATLIDELLRSGIVPRELFAVAERLAEHPQVAELEARGCPIFTVPERVFARLSELETPSGLLALIEPAASDPQHILHRPGIVLLLAGVSDPGNAGTLLRSAEAFGAAGVLFGRGGVDPYASKVVRAAMGSLFRVPIATVDAGWLLPAAAAADRLVVAADVDGEDITGLSLPRRVVLAIGNERRGVRDWLPRWDRSVRIPHAGPAQSLNAAVAGSILLYVLSRATRDVNSLSSH